MRKKLILGQAFLLFFILIFFFFLWFQVKGNPLLYLKAGRAIQDYYEEYYQDLDLKKGEVTYHQDDQSYTITYTNQEEPLLNFTITYHKGKITSNYEENYENGKELLEDRSPSFALTCIKKLHFFQCLQDFTPAMVLYFEYVT